MKSGVRIIEALMKRWEQRQYQKVADMLMRARDEWLAQTFACTDDDDDDADKDIPTQ